jgi:hypothetical protein
LNKCQVGSDQVNVYGVVLDATFPHKSFKSSRYICTIKIADQSSPIDKNGICEPTSVVFFANKFDDLPVCQRIGDVVRIHRAGVTTYKDKRQLTVNICFNSSWALFPATPMPKATKGQEVEPIAFFGKSIHTTFPEIKLIKGLRKWTEKSFTNYTMMSSKYITPLANVAGKFGE